MKKISVLLNEKDLGAAERVLTEHGIEDEHWIENSRALGVDRIRHSHGYDYHPTFENHLLRAVVDDELCETLKAALEAAFSKKPERLHYLVEEVEKAVTIGPERTAEKPQAPAR